MLFRVLHFHNTFHRKDYLPSVDKKPVLKDRVSFTSQGNLVRCATWDPPKIIDESYNIALVRLKKMELLIFFRIFFQVQFHVNVEKIPALTIERHETGQSLHNYLRNMALLSVLKRESFITRNLALERIIHLNIGNNHHCDPENRQLKTKCVHNFVQHKLNCKLPWGSGYGCFLKKCTALNRFL